MADEIAAAALAARWSDWKVIYSACNSCWPAEISFSLVCTDAGNILGSAEEPVKATSLASAGAIRSQNCELEEAGNNGIRIHLTRAVKTGV